MTEIINNIEIFIEPNGTIHVLSSSSNVEYVNGLINTNNINGMAGQMVQKETTSQTAISIKNLTVGIYFL